MCVLSCSVSHSALGAHGTCYGSVAKAYFYLICWHPFFCCVNQQSCMSQYLLTHVPAQNAQAWEVGDNKFSFIQILRDSREPIHTFKFWGIPGNPFIPGLVAASWLPLTIFNRFSSLCLSMLHFQIPPPLFKDINDEVKDPIKHSTLF